MKRIVLTGMFIVGACCSSFEGSAQIPVLNLITGVAKKVIKAIDLRIQRLQNETIWLQNAQKTLENTMSQLKLNDISDWTNKQKELYASYFEELQKVKTVIRYYQRIRDITDKQARMVSLYHHAWATIQTDRHFNAGEIAYMGSIYTGILEASAGNMDRILTVLQAFTTEMSDAKRLEIINQAADEVDRNYNDLKLFNSKNALLSIQRARDQNDMALTRALYGIR